MAKDTTRPRVLLLATRVPKQSGDGTPSFVLDGATSLSSEFDITLLAPRIADATEVSLLGGVKVKRFPYFPAGYESLAEDAIMPQLNRNPRLWLQAVSLTAMMALHALREHKVVRFDLVHAQWLLPAGLIAMLLKSTGVPYIVTAQGADAFRLDSRALRKLKFAIIERSERFVGVSSEIVDRFPGVSVPSTVQASGIDFAMWAELVGRRSPRPGLVLYIGRLASKKGVADLVHAIAATPEARLRVAGDGPKESELMALAERLGVTDRVTFLGRCSRKEIAAEMRNAYCVAIPSVTAPDGDRDGTPNVVGEAAAGGVPIVASDIAGIAELLTDGLDAYLHQPGDVASICERLREAIHDPAEAARRAEAAKRHLRELLDAESVRRNYSTWYREAITASSRSRSNRRSRVAESAPSHYQLRRASPRSAFTSLNALRGRKYKSQRKDQ